MPSLSLYILLEIASIQADLGGGVGVSLSPYKKELGVPDSTFYRAVKELIDMGFVERRKRDNYAITSYTGFLFTDAIGTDA